MAETELKALHIFNGDSTKALFDKAGITGQSMVWREMLCEGPARELIDKEFWKLRASFMNDTYEIPTEKYLDFTEKEIEKRELNKFEQIILWFEYDLFCQVNLWATVSFIIQQKYEGKIFLIDMSTFQKADRFVGLGELDFHEYPALKKSAKVLESQDVVLAIKLWKIWCTNQADLFHTVKETNSKNFPYLTKAIEAYQSLLPNWDHGLSSLELNIIEYVQNEHPTWQSLMKHLLQNNTHLGWGDSQYGHLLKKMDFMFEIIDEKYYLKAGVKEEIHSKKAFHIPRIYGGFSCM